MSFISYHPKAAESSQRAEMRAALALAASRAKPAKAGVFATWRNALNIRDAHESHVTDIESLALRAFGRRTA